MANKKSLKNLKPSSTRTKEELQEISRKGGIASGEARREKKNMREWLELALEMPSKNDASKTKLEVSMLKVAEGMEEGDLRALDRAINILNNGININHNYGGREMTQEEAAAYIREIMEKM